MKLQVVELRGLEFHRVDEEECHKENRVVHKDTLSCKACDRGDLLSPIPLNEAYSMVHLELVAIPKMRDVREE